MASIYENSPLGTIIVSIDAIDYDENSQLSYYILSGDPFNQFEIGQSGEIYINKALDRETLNKYKLEIIVSDGRFATRTWVTVDILGNY
jgi:protocadherin Fat 1/2/3